MRSKLLMVSGMAIGTLAIGTILTACGLKSGGGAKVAAVPQIPASASLPAPISRPPALPNPTLIAPVEAAALGNNIGGRPDPFSALPLTPTVVIKPNPDPVVPSIAPSIISLTPQLQPPPTAAAAQQPAPLPIVAVPATVPPAAVVAPVAAPIAAPIAPVVAPSPTIREAQTIAVSGIVQAGSRTSIIVQVPNETSSRYAVVGDYLANGKVLVKRIEMQGAEPLVVLEQDGAEFIKPVGSGGL